ncbi:hypothetical protein ACFYM2_24430 [Streptomyces sp. NPDC006711]|uniref:hypothetical protein n=1 Tax=unclassified Streptomyces TaxID=2593676 RepID=UPI0033C14C96
MTRCPRCAAQLAHGAGDWWQCVQCEFEIEHGALQYHEVLSAAFEEHPAAFFAYVLQRRDELREDEPAWQRRPAA